MLNDADYIDWCLHLRLAETTRATIAAARSRNPTRRVGGGRQNVSGRYPSRKMGVTIQFESHRVELPFVYEMEHDPGVLEYYDQPPSIPLAYPTAGGRRLSVMHTPDYFVLRHDSAGWVECKTEGDLEKLAIKSPHRYLRDNAGKWCCPPGEAHASALGLDYRVWSSTNVDWKLQRNLQFLDDYLRYDSESLAGPIHAAVTTIVEAEPGILLSDLLATVRGVVEPDVIYSLIASGELYVNLSKVVLAEPARVRLFANAKIAAAFREPARAPEENAGNRARINGLTAETSGTHSEAFRLLAMASERDLEVANRRFGIVKSRLEQGTELCLIPERTLRRWVGQYRSAESLYGNGYVGLLAKVRVRGNRTGRLSEESRNLLVQFVENDYEDLRQKTKLASWAALKRKCDELGIVAPTYATFCTAVRERPTFLRTLKRQGRRAAYRHSSFYSNREFPRLCRGGSNSLTFSGVHPRNSKR